MWQIPATICSRCPFGGYRGSQILNLIILICKMYIYQTKLQSKDVSFHGYLGLLHNHFAIERQASINQGTLERHTRMCCGNSFRITRITSAYEKFCRWMFDCVLNVRYVVACVGDTCWRYDMLAPIAHMYYCICYCTDVCAAEARVGAGGGRRRPEPGRTDESHICVREVGSLSVYILWIFVG